ncbi:MAG: PAS domain S-box protein [Deltaproteobacteria bacterium]|nr:PAS domain S-box protein [Deltaproteobacteria bacterium]
MDERVLFDEAPVALLVVGADGHITRCNRALLTLTGRAEPELLGAPFEALFLPEHADAARAWRVAAHAAPVTEPLEVACRAGEGEPSWVRLTASADRDALVVWLVEREAASAAATRRELGQRLGERVKELTALHGVARLLLGGGGHLDQTLDAVVALLPPAMQFPALATAAVRCGARLHASAGHRATPWMLSADFACADGTAGRIEVAYQEERGFLPEEQAVLDSTAEMLRGELERRSAEARLLQAHERFDLALDTAQMGVWEWDVEHDQVRWSHQLSRMCGLDHDAGGMGAQRALVHPDDRDRLFERLRRAADGADDLQHLEFRFARPGGGWRSMLASARIVREPPARATRIIAALLDVSERRALEDGLRQAQKVEALGQVASGVAHDFNNLFAVLLSGSELLLGGMRPDDPRYELVKDMRTASESAHGLATQLLAFSRKAAYSPAAVDVSALVHKLRPLLVRIAQHQVELRLEVAPGAGMVWADPAQVEQVVLNLFVNARDASREGGVVTISTAALDGPAASRWGARPEPHVVLAVEDCGPGLAPGIRERIFEPFFTTKEPGKGTGLGLAVVASVARHWQGHVQVDSEPGRGCCFRVLLPRLPD